MRIRACQSWTLRFPEGVGSGRVTSFRSVRYVSQEPGSVSGGVEGQVCQKAVRPLPPRFPMPGLLLLRKAPQRATQPLRKRVPILLSSAPAPLQAFRPSGPPRELYEHPARLRFSSPTQPPDPAETVLWLCSLISASDFRLLDLRVPLRRRPGLRRLERPSLLRRPASVRVLRAVQLWSFSVIRVRCVRLTDQTSRFPVFQPSSLSHVVEPG